jgi:hypothetical protein
MPKIWKKREETHLGNKFEQKNANIGQKVSEGRGTRDEERWMPMPTADNSFTHKSFPTVLLMEWTRLTPLKYSLK